MERKITEKKTFDNSFSFIYIICLRTLIFFYESHFFVTGTNKQNERSFIYEINKTEHRYFFPLLIYFFS